MGKEKQMKRIILSIGTAMVFGSFGFAGGDIAPIAVSEAEENDNNSTFYIGVGAVYNRIYSIDSGWFDNSIPTQDQTAGLTGIIGYNYNRYLSIEGRISATFWERDYSDLTTYSIFLKPQYRFQEDDRESDEYDDAYFTIYGLIGFGNSYVEGSSGDSGHYSAWPDVIGQEIMSETGFQWGFGLSYTFVDVDYGERRDTWSLFIDYTMTANDADIYSRLYDYGNGKDTRVYNELSTDGLTVGLTYTF